MKPLNTQHLLSIDDLSAEHILSLIDLAHAFQSKKDKLLQNQTIATAFFEPSTRTRLSFAMAAQQLGAQVLDLAPQFSSLRKGESVEDTIRTIEAMGVNTFVIRHSDSETVSSVAASVAQESHIINAGTGADAHPTQALLDVMTILSHKSDISKLKVCIIGDIAHSRVASDLSRALKKLDVAKLCYVGPTAYMPEESMADECMEDLQAGLADSDVVVCLRVQRERLKDQAQFDQDTFVRRYRVDSERFSEAKPDAILMHPGPFNRGVEISSELVDHPRSTIHQQVHNGVYIRMAVLAKIHNASPIS